MDRIGKINWERVETAIRTLYLEQDLSLTELMKEMEEKYHFKAKKHHYEEQFKKWGIQKYRKSQEWRIISHKLAKRKRERKESEVTLNGIPIKPKRLKKEIQRYRTLSTAGENSLSEPLPPTPTGFTIRTPPPVNTIPISTPTEFHCGPTLAGIDFAFCTPSPRYAASISTPIGFLYNHPPADIGLTLMSQSPFYEFNTIFSNSIDPFLSNLENGSSDLTHFSQNIHSIILNGPTESDCGNLSGSFDKIVDILMPENLFPNSAPLAGLAMSQRNLSPDLRFLRLTMYLVSNNFLGANEAVSERVYKLVRHSLNPGLMGYLKRLGGPTVEALIENLFRLAVEAEDHRTVTLLINLGVNPNEQVIQTKYGYGRTPLQRACELQNLKIVKALIDGGAEVDRLIGPDTASSTLMLALSYLGDAGRIKPRIDPELVQVLLDAGALVNPGFGHSPLARAAAWGHVEIVNILVSAGADVNAYIGIHNYFEQSPLILAMRWGKRLPQTDVLAMIQTLLDAGAVVLDAGRTLTVAMLVESIDLIEWLLKNGAHVTEAAFCAALGWREVNIVNLILKFGGQVTAAIVESAVSDNPELLFFLLDTTHGSNNAICKSAALIMSIKCMKMDLILRLEDSGAQLQKGRKLTEAIRSVREAGNIEILRFLLLHSKSQHRIMTFESLETKDLSMAIRKKQYDVVELLLLSGVNVNDSRDRLIWSPLSAAIQIENLSLVKQLLNANAAVNGFEFSHHIGYTTTVLPAAVNWGNRSLMQDLIDAGADTDALDQFGGHTGLFLAVEKRDITSIKCLIEAGANINASAALFFGQTALVAASKNSDLDMVQYLLGLGADPDEWSLLVAISGRKEVVQTLLAARLHRYKRISRGWGCGALQYAIKLGNAAMINLLLMEGIDPNKAIHMKLEGKDYCVNPDYDPFSEPYVVTGISCLGFAIKMDESRDLWIVRALLNHGADPNGVVTDNHETALLLAIKNNNPALVKVLIAAGALASPILGLGVQRTPLQLAVEEGRLDIINILLDNGADVNALPYDKYGATALQFAAVHGYIGIALLLLQRGADVNASPAKIGGRTALEGAAENGRIHMLQLLLGRGALIIGPGLSQYNRARELALQKNHHAAYRVLEKYNEELFESNGNLVGITDPLGDLEACI